MWESLVLEQGVKNHLLEYATSALLFTDKGVSKNVISWNRYIPLTYVLVHPKRHKSVVVSSGSGGGLHHLFCHPMFVWMFSCLCNWLPELEMSVDISVKRNVDRPRICDETCQVHTFGS